MVRQEFGDVPPGITPEKPPIADDQFEPRKFLGVAMTDAKGDRTLRPHKQAEPDAYVHISERRADGIVISGTKAIVTGGPYMHELLVMPCRTMTEEDADFAVCCAVPIDAENLTIVARPAGRPGENAVVFSGSDIICPGGLRHNDEPVRHKMLDAVGDLAMAGAPIIGRYCGVKAGHEMTNKLLHALFASPDAWCWDTLSEEQSMGCEMLPDGAFARATAIAV